VAAAANLYATIKFREQNAKIGTALFKIGNYCRGSELKHDKVTRSADKSLARPTSRCILFDGENISFDVSLVMYTNSTNISPIMIINRIYETQNLLSL
jgi:hypothetical protein